MNAVTAARLALLAPEADHAIIAAIAPVMDATFAPAGINTILRRAHILGQLCHESGHFRRLKENLSYSAPRIGQVWHRLAQRAASLAGHPEALANAAYANKLGNGNEASGDGYRFCGRGLIQITGRANYARFGQMSGVDLISSPDLAADPATSVHIAIAFWNANDCNAKADADDVAAITRAINGPAYEGLDARSTLVDLAKTIFN